MTIILRNFYCEAYEFNEGQCTEQCALCREEDADEEMMREHFSEHDDIGDSVNLKRLNDDITLVIANGLHQQRNKALREAINACIAEHLEDPQDEADKAYDLAIRDCVSAIERLMEHGSPQETPKGNHE